MAQQTYNRRDYLKTLGLSLGSLMVWGCDSLNEGRRSNRRPNIVLFFTDDQGTLDVNCYGSKDISTPNLDNMAARGMRFTDFYVAAPVCSASRAALLTGCYHLRTGVGNGQPGHRRTRPIRWRSCSDHPGVRGLVARAIWPPPLVCHHGHGQGTSGRRTTWRT
jgi:hypothetical protein